MLYGLLNRESIPFEPKTDIPDLSGKVILITGGNIGLGRETILQLSQHNPSKIYLAARNASKAESAIESIRAVVPDAPIHFLQCDLSSFESILQCAKEFVQREKRLDLLFLNAGVMALPPGFTSEGYEIQFGTNQMGHALLTKLLLPTMLRTAKDVKGADVRIIVLSSIAHVGSWGIKYATLKTDMANSFTLSRYMQSKLANVLFARALAKRYGGEGITAVSVHPGMVETDIYNTYFETYGFIGRAAHKVKKAVWTTVPEGAKGQLWAATAKLEGHEGSETTKGRGVKNGVYYAPVGVEGQGTRLAVNDRLADELWEWTQKELEGWVLET